MLAVALSGLGTRAAVTVTVPGTSNPWLAGMPDDTSAGRRPDFDYAPEHSPVEVPGLRIQSGRAVMIRATGAVNKGPNFRLAGPDGDLSEIAGKIVGGEHGMSDLVAPKNSLIGVFLGPDEPDLSPTPDGLNFGSNNSREFQELRPDLKQPFFMGDGQSGGRAQRFIAPEGATRLFLGTMDGVGWYNNSGAFSVEVELDLPKLSIADLSLPEGTGGETRSTVTVRLSEPGTEPVSFHYATSEGTATPDSDYTSTTESATIPAGLDSVEIGITILGDTLFETDETFFILLSDPVNGSLDNGLGTITIINDDAPNQPPEVSLTHPDNGTSIAAGSAVTIAATASDPDGTVREVVFFLDNTPLHTDVTAPFEMAWTDPIPGNHQIWATATDDTGATARSPSVEVTVSKPVPIPPQVSLSEPSAGSLFSSASNIRITAQVSDPDGEIERVDFYADSKLIGSRQTQPFQIFWSQIPPGTYQLQATATDDSGLESVSDSVEVTVRDLNGDIAIIRAIDSGEISAMEDHLAELNFSVRLFTPNEITAENLRGFRLILWNDLGRSEPDLTRTGLTALEESYRAGTGLYLIGPHIASAAGHLDETARHEWSQLAHVTPATTSGEDGYVMFADTAPAHPIPHGRFGEVGMLHVPGAIDRAALSDEGAETLGFSGDSAALVSHPAGADIDLGGPRSVTQGFLVGSDATAEFGPERKQLFQNAICWLMRCAPCNTVNVRLDATQPESTLHTGKAYTYTVSLLHEGECRAAGGIVTHTLPAGLLFSDARCAVGTWSRSGQEIRFHLGQVTGSSRTETQVTVIPVEPGNHSIRLEARINGPEVSDTDNRLDLSLPTEGPAIPLLKLEKNGDGSYALRIGGTTTGVHTIEASPDLASWSRVGGTADRTWVLPPPARGGSGSSAIFYRATRE